MHADMSLSSSLDPCHACADDVPAFPLHVGCVLLVLPHDPQILDARLPKLDNVALISADCSSAADNEVATARRSIVVKFNMVAMTGASLWRSLIELLTMNL